LLSVGDAVTSLRQERAEVPSHGWPSGAPACDFVRSPAAARVGRFAASEGLFLFHYEHRVRESHWLGSQEEELWQDGRMAEPKYGGFRHDLAVGSFHPGHRAKWTTHELCHALVGFAWRPDASRLFHATAARLAELLPVALWYYFDEVRLLRCPKHRGQGPLFRSYCPDCEAASANGPAVRDAQAHRWVSGGLDVVQRELAAVARTRRLGRPVSSRIGTLDLCSDGIAYAASHHERLNGAAFRMFAERFLVEGAGYWTSLDDLEGRVIEVTGAIMSGVAPSPIAWSAEQGRWLWTVQDLGWRLCRVLDMTTGAASAQLRRLIDDLADATPGPEAVGAAQRGYRELSQRGGVPDADDVLAVGYDLGEGFGRSARQVAEGLQTVTPLTLELLEDAEADFVRAFVANDRSIRVPLGDRFAASLDGVLEALARYESGLRAQPASTETSLLGDGVAYQLRPDVQVLVGPWDWVRLAERAEAGGVALRDGVLTGLDGLAVREEEERGLLLGVDPGGERLIVEIPVELARSLRAGTAVGVDTEVVEELLALGVLVPTRWSMDEGLESRSEVGMGHEMQPPVAPQRPVESTTHGDVRVDPYAWLRERESDEVIAHLKAENAYTKNVAGASHTTADAIYTEVVDRLQETDATPPARRGAFGYYRRTEEGKDYGIHCRTPWGQEEEEVLLDENVLAKGHGYHRVGVLAISPDQRRLAYSTDNSGSENFVLRVRELATGEELDDRIENTKYSLAWGSGSDVVYYTVADAIDRPYRVMRHRLGDDPSEDTVVFEESDQRFYVSVERSLDGRCLVIHTGGKTTGECHLIWTDDAEETVHCVWPRQEGVEAYLYSGGDQLFLRTNQGAPNFQLLTGGWSGTGVEWQPFVVGDLAVYMEEVLVLEGHLVLSERSGCLQRFRVLPRNGAGASWLVDFDDPAYALSAGPNLAYDAQVFRYGYATPRTPNTVFDVDLKTRERANIKQTAVLGGFDTDAYVVHRQFATAPDGTQVPITVCCLKGTPQDGTAPGLLFGYGSYGIPYDPTFRSTLVSLIDRGIVVATAHIRGGGEGGKLWYEDGKFLKKQNTFSDFIACSEELIASGWVSSDALAISGGSAGGLLMGAVMNARPDLFHAVLARVPFVDSINTMLDDTLPLTVTEYDEWGNPNDPEYYHYMKSYSPYENITEVAYPQLLATAGLNDPRVGYWEPAKWVARLRAHTTSDAPILLRTNMGAGHGGASGRYGWIREVAIDYAWVVHALGRE